MTRPTPEELAERLMRNFAAMYAELRDRPVPAAAVALFAAALRAAEQRGLERAERVAANAADMLAESQEPDTVIRVSTARSIATAIARLKESTP